MARRTEYGEGPVLTKEEERRLGESLRKALISDRPNPSREGCPDPKTLRDLAFHKKAGDPEAFERATAHMAECSACVRDALGYVEEYKELRRRRRAARAVVGLVAVLVVTVAVWVLWRPRPGPGNEEIAREVPSVRDPALEIAQYEPVTIELPARLRGRPGAEPQIVLGRGRLLIEIHLPAGSPAGVYRFRILAGAGEMRKAAEATARTESGVTRLTLALDTSDLPPGAYTLSVLEPDLPDWLPHPLTIK